MFMGITGPIEGKEWQTVMLVVNVGELTVNSSTFSALQDSISSETLVLGRIQTHSLSTVFIDYCLKASRKTLTVESSSRGAHAHGLVGPHQIQRMYKHSFYHSHKCLKSIMQSKYTIGARMVNSLNALD